METKEIYQISEKELLELLRAKHELTLLHYYHADKGIPYDTIPPGYSENYYDYTGKKDLEKYKVINYGTKRNQNNSSKRV